MSKQMTIEDLIGDRALWPMLRDLITSNQIAEHRIHGILENNPEFKAWVISTSRTEPKSDPERWVANLALTHTAFFSAHDRLFDEKETE